MKIHIEWTSAESDCDTCGMNFADGARIYFDGKLAFDLTPIAACFDGANYSESDVMRVVLAHLGHELTEEHAA